MSKSKKMDAGDPTLSSTPSSSSSPPPMHSHRRSSSTPTTAAVAAAAMALATAHDEGNDGIQSSPPSSSTCTASSAPAATHLSNSTSVPTMMRWLHTHHLLAGALFLGEHHHQHQAAVAGQGQLQPQQWLAAGMEIVAGMMTAVGGGDNNMITVATPDSCAIASPGGTTDGPSATTMPPPVPMEDHGVVRARAPLLARARPPNDAHGVDEDEDDDDSVPLLPRSGMEEEREDLRQGRLDPIALRRSASSAFGCPFASSSTLCDYGTRGRTHSYSGHSDPGTATTSTTSSSTSAFHAWR